MKNKLDSISQKWQLGHLKYYFGLNRANDSLSGKFQLIAKAGRADQTDYLDPKRDSLSATERAARKLAKA